MKYELRKIAQWMLGLFIVSGGVKGIICILGLLFGDPSEAGVHKKQLKNVIIAIIVAGICLAIVSQYAMIKPY